MEEHLISEVKDEVVKMAITRKITIVMDKVFLNITAIDLTDDIIAELKEKIIKLEDYNENFKIFIGY